jgi:hypothetical protein
MKSLAILGSVLTVLATGCAAPGWADGIFGETDFELRSQDPLAQAGGSERDMLVVMAEIDGETLRTVSIGLNRFQTLPHGEPVDAGDGSPGDARPFVDVTVGELVREDRGDGVEIISSDNATRAASTGGSVTLDELGAQVAGSFRVDLDDGGYLEGSFLAERVE